MREYPVVVADNFADKRTNADCFSVRYGFRPDSLAGASLSLEKDGSDYILQAEDNKLHVFRGSAMPPKNIECVLIFDEASGTYVVRRLDCSLRVSLTREQVKLRPAASSPPRFEVPERTPQPTPLVDELSDDDFGDLATELADDLKDPIAGASGSSRVIGTAGPIATRSQSWPGEHEGADDQSSSEEE